MAGCYPRPVAALPVSTAVVSVACGENFSMVLLETGQIYAWGDNSRGQLGQEDTQVYETVVPLLGAAQSVPFRAISAGYYHCLALSSAGKVYSWGDNRYGQLGRKVVGAGSSSPRGEAQFALPDARCCSVPAEVTTKKK